MRCNPFATRYVEPGRIPWLCDNSLSLPQLVQRFKALKQRAAIVGPHGSGKSTLLEHLQSELGVVCYRQNAFAHEHVGSAGTILSIQLRRTSRPWRQLRQSLKFWETGRLLVVDGFEQLHALGRLWLISTTHRRRMGLLVTSHQDTWLPKLVETQVTLELAKRIVLHLTADHEAEEDHFFEQTRGGSLSSQASLLPSRLLDVLEVHYSTNHGNMREILMSLYDDFLRHARKKTNSADKVTV